ncbi:retrovirus-related pol polyprotein from transposon TNT 1-94 [Tanacetum coccineum]
MQISQLKETRSDADRTLDFEALDFQITQLTEKVTVLKEQNELFRVENEKVKQHYKELHDSIKITRAKHIEYTTALLTENENLKVQIKDKMKCVTMDYVKPKVLAPGMYAIDVEPIPPHNRNNREVYLDYLNHLKESVATIREIVEEARLERPLDTSLASACLYTKHSQELVDRIEVMGTMQRWYSANVDNGVDEEQLLFIVGGQDNAIDEDVDVQPDLLKMKAEALNEQTTASRPIKTLMVFTEMHNAHTVAQARCLELEAELSKLKDRIQKDDHNELVKRFSNLEGRQNRGHGNNARGTGATGYEGAQTRVGNSNLGQVRQIKCYNYNAQDNGVDEEQLLFIVGGQDNAIDEDVDEQPVQDLALNADKVFQADDCDAFDSDDVVCEHHEVHEMHYEVQPNYVINSHADYTSDSNMILYGRLSNVSMTTQNNVIDKSLTAELATYKEQVELYERRAKFELTEREQKIDEQLRIVIADRNLKEENLKRELHFVKLQLTSTINHNKSMVEEVTKAAIGYKNPFYLSKAKQVQPALYFDQEIVKPNHARILFMTRGYPRIADTTKNLIKNEAEALKEQTTALKPIKALTVYPLNTPATFVPKMTTTVVQARYLELEAELSKLCDKGQKDDHTELVKCFSNLEITQLTEKVTVLQEQNELFRAENAKIKQHYKELYGKDVEPIPPHNRNNKEVHLDYLKHLKESVETLHEIVKEAKVERPLDRSLASACLYTKHSQELLEYVIGTCPKDFNKQDKKHASTPLTRKKVYYVEGLGHNLFSIGQFCDSDLEVAFRKHSCYVRDTDGVELIKGSRGSNLYTISVEDMMKSSPICLLSKASKNKSWLWHRRLNHLNFGTINDLARKDLVRGLPILKFKKDHLCFACQLGKSKKHTHTPKTENTNLEVLNTLHMDLCRPIRVQTINGNKYILVIVDDYSSFTWVKFLRSKYETPEFFIKFLKQIQVGLNKTVRYIHTDNGTEFINQELPSKMALSKDGTVLLLRLLGQC